MKQILLSIIVFIVLLVSFIYKDIGNRPGLRAYFFEAKIYYRLARSQEQGAFSDAGLLGFCDSKLDLRGEVREQYSMSTYRAGHCPDYKLYESQSGLQGLLYSLIDKFYKDPIIFKIFCASFLSAVLTAWFLWLYAYFGPIPSFLIMMTIPAMQELIFMADNIAQVLGATYLIMVAVFWAYKKKIKGIGTVVFLVVLIKLLLNGFEYIFTALLLPFLPLVFYAVLNRMPFPRVIQAIFLIMKSAALACLTALLILTAQISAADSLGAAIHHFINRAMARTFYPNLLSEHEWNMTTSITRSQLLCRDLSSPCIGIGSFNVSLGVMILFFCMISILAIHLYRCYRQRELLAILITTWVSILCPLSWILIAKGHSATQPDGFLVWHMPFTMLGMALTMVTLDIWINGRRRT